jgi:hypothetical protein
MTPTLGADVLVFTDPARNNGSDTAPAKITRVWTDQMVSVRIFCDGPDDGRATVLLYESREAAAAAPRGAGRPPSGAWRPALDRGLVASGRS